MKQLLAQQILCKDPLQVETATIHRGSIKLRQFHHGQTRGAVFVGMWDEVPTNLKSGLEEIFPADVERSVAYDLKKNPGKYLNATLKMCRVRRWKQTHRGGRYT